MAFERILPKLIDSKKYEKYEIVGRIFKTLADHNLFSEKITDEGKRFFELNSSSGVSRTNGVEEIASYLLKFDPVAAEDILVDFLKAQLKVCKDKSSSIIAGNVLELIPNLKNFDNAKIILSALASGELNHGFSNKKIAEILINSECFEELELSFKEFIENAEFLIDPEGKYSREYQVSGALSDISPIVEVIRALTARGLKNQEFFEFLENTLKEDLEDPGARQLFALYFLENHQNPRAEHVLLDALKKYQNPDSSPDVYSINFENQIAKALASVRNQTTTELMQIILSDDLKLIPRAILCFSKTTDIDELQALTKNYERYLELSANKKREDINCQICLATLSAVHMIESPEVDRIYLKSLESNHDTLTYITKLICFKKTNSRGIDPFPRPAEFNVQLYKSIIEDGALYNYHQSALEGLGKCIEREDVSNLLFELIPKMRNEEQKNFLIRLYMARPDAKLIGIFLESSYNRAQNPEHRPHVNIDQWWKKGISLNMGDTRLIREGMKSFAERKRKFCVEVDAQ